MPRERRIVLPTLRIIRTIELTEREARELKRYMAEEGITDPCEGALGVLRAALNEAADINEASDG
jgi:hypothetical protein